MNRSIEFNSKYIDYKDDILSLNENFSSSNGHTIKDHRNIIKKFKLGDFEVNIKSFGVPPMLNDFVLFTFKLHENGINFLDHSPGNTLVKFHNSSPIFYLIDLNRMKFEKMNFTKRIMNFRRLTNDKEVLKIISKEYARLYNRDFDEVFSLMVKYSNQFLSRRSFRKKLKKILVK